MMKKTTNRVIAFILSLTLIIGLMPVNMVVIYADSELIDDNAEPTFTIKVIDGNNNNVSNANIEIKYLDGEEEQNITGITNASGAASFDDLYNYVSEQTEAVDISVSVKKEKYQDVTQNYSLTKDNVGEGVDITCLEYINDITIKPYNGEYDGAEHSAVAIRGRKSTDRVRYSMNDGEYVKACPKLKNVTEGTIRVRVERANYATIEEEYNVSVTPKNIENIVKVDFYNGVYDGKKHNAVTISNVSGSNFSEYTVQYSTDNGNTFSSSVPKVIDVGEKDILVKITGDNIVEKIFSGTAVISKNEMTNVKIEVYGEDSKEGAFDGTSVYDGQAHNIVNVTLEDSQNDSLDNYVISYNFNGETTANVPTIKNAGEYTVIVKIENANYTPIEKEIKVKIKPKDIDGITINPYNNVYDGSEHELIQSIAGKKSNDVVTYRLGDVGEYSENIPTASDAGTYKIYVKIVRGSNYNEYIGSVNAIIKKVQINAGLIPYDKDGTKIYDGKEHDAFVIWVNDIEVNDIDFTIYDETNDETYENVIPKIKNAGEYKYKFSAKKKDDVKGNFEPINDLSYTVKIEKARLDYIIDESKLGITLNTNNIYDCSLKNILSNLSDQNNIIYYNQETNSDFPSVLGNPRYKIKQTGTTVSASIDNTTGMLTYEGEGQIVVEAYLSGGSNHNSVTINYTIDVKAADVPEYTMTSPVDNANKNDYNWYGSDVVIKPEVDGCSIVMFNGDDFDPINTEAWKDVIQLTHDGIYKNYKVQFRYENGDISAPVNIDNFAIDTTAPSDISFNLKTQSNVGNNLPFGYFTSQTITVTVKGSDSNISSGIKTVKFIKTSPSGTSTFVVKEISDDPNNVEVDFNLFKPYVGSISVIITDAVGHSSVQTIANNNNSNIINTDGFIMIEENKPELSEIDTTGINSNGKSVIKNNKLIFNQNVKFAFNVSDNESGLNGVNVKINDAEYSGFPKSYTEEKTVNSDFVIDTSGIQPDNNGCIRINVDVTDNAGNFNNGECLAYIDKTSPEITGFSFSLNENIDVPKNNKNIYDIAQVESYGFYFKENVTVYVYANDPERLREYSTGVKSITYKAVNVNGVVEYSGTKNVDADNKISFDIAENFKGQIYAYATDYVGNDPTNSGETDSDGFVHPNGSIVENLYTHNNTSSIVINAPQSTGSENKASSYVYSGSAVQDKVMDYNVSENVPLYNSNPSFGINVKDSYSGIREVKWTIINGNSETSGTVQVSNSGELFGDTDGWSVVSTDNNLVTQISKTQSVNGNSNDMVLLVELTDRAGNKSYDYYCFGIDKTVPVINVTYDNNKNDSANGSYYNADRTATIVVTERNFNANNINVNIRNADGSVPQLSQWTRTGGASESDSDKYTATIRFSADGNYSFNVSFKDNAGNAADSYNSESFIIDKTQPVVSVDYDNNSAKNGKYFNKARTATIIINEHNFDKNRVSVNISATLNGIAVSVPEVSWTSNGDIHTAKIKYTADADYSFAISVKDKASNTNSNVNYGDSVAPQKFTIDTVINAPKIIGVDNNSAYSGDLVPEISFEDINFDSYSVKLLQTKIDKVNVDVTDKFIKDFELTSIGGSGKFDTFKKVEDTDGIYNLTVLITDKAGNSEQVSIMFTVNRFGSVYSYDSYIISLNDKYEKKVDRDLIITEYNPVKLKNSSLRIDITCDGKTVATQDDCIINQIDDGTGLNGWYKYEYTIPADIFTADGVYKIIINSEDETGNYSESSENDGSILFRIDNTAPEITNIAGLEKSTYNANNIDVTFEAFDAIGMKQVTVYVNDSPVKKLENMSDLINCTDMFEIGEGANQKVRIVVEDLAGNITDTDDEAFSCSYEFEKVVTVSTNFFVRWFANKVLFFGSIIGIIVAIALMVILIVRRRNRL